MLTQCMLPHLTRQSVCGTHDANKRFPVDMAQQPCGTNKTCRGPPPSSVAILSTHLERSLQEGVEALGSMLPCRLRHLLLHPPDQFLQERAFGLDKVCVLARQVFDIAHHELAIWACCHCSVVRNDLGCALESLKHHINIWQGNTDA